MLSTVRVSIVVVMLAFSVCSNGVCSPVTSTVVDVVPTSSVRFTVEFCPSWTLILRVEVLKPSLLIVSVYSPGLSREYWYAPVADVVALNDSPVAELFNARLAPAIAGANLALKSSATGESFNATTSATGAYQYSLLKPGEYTLTISKDGFNTSTRKINVQLGQNSTVNLTLEVGTTSTTVEVTGEQTPSLQTENANITTTIDTRTVESIPNPGNDVTYVAQTAPGVSMNTSSGNGIPQ